MTRLLLIRHAHHDFLGRALAGWLPGVPLSAKGKAQAARLAERLSEAGIQTIYSSPLERAMETAQPLADRLGLRIEVRADLGEIRYGDWTGRTMAELEADPLWRRFNTHRASTRAPGGELMLEIQARMVRELDCIRQSHPDGVATVFSHGEPIRTAMMYYLGVPLDLFARIEIHPASISTIDVDDDGPRVIALNQTEELPRY